MKIIILFFIVFFNTALLCNEKLEKVSIQFMWHDQYEFAGFYVAKEKGFYKELGLEVEFKKFTIDKNITDIVLSGEATFGTSSTSLLIDKSKGKNIVLLGSIFQSSPLVLLGLKSENLKSIQDIKNKRIMLTEDQQYFATLQAMLASKNIHFGDIQLIHHTFNVDDLINKKTDLMLSYTTNEPYVLKERGHEGVIFHPKDYGFDFYEELIFTSKEFANKNPEIVEKFYKATIKGWEYAFENIDEISKLVYEKYNPQNKTLNSLVYEALEMKKLSYTKDGEIGTITKQRLKLIENSYRLLGLLKGEVNLDELIYFNKKKKKAEIKFTKEEKAYLEQTPFISMCIDPNWMPFEKNDKGKHIGISADYFKIIEKKLNKPIKLISTDSWTQTLEYMEKRKCDIISLAMKTPQREKYMDFTNPYITMPLVIATNIDAPLLFH